MAGRIYALLCLLGAIALSTSCYEECMHKFSLDMDKLTPIASNSTSLTSDFCRGMSKQIDCLNAALVNCSPQQRALVESLLTVFIQPDYKRTCTGDNTTSEMADTNSSSAIGNSFAGTGLSPVLGGPSFTGIIPTSGRTLIICRQKFQACQKNFNQTFTASMAVYNISGLCQSLKQYTICYINLLSSECGHLVPKNVIYNMQKHYGGMCSNDAQANTYTMIECANMTMKCYIQFNSSFSSPSGDYNIIPMCSAIDNYTKCMQNVSQTSECSPFIKQGLVGIQQMKRKHNAYCGADNGQSAAQCGKNFEDCFSPFNRTFFPGLHAANLTLICSSLETYTSCVSHLTPSCSQQLGQVLGSVQTLKTQFSQKCHPNIIKLASCAQVKECSQTFMKNYSIGTPTNAGLCRSIGDYFPCVERSLDACQLPQSTTEVGFGGLGALMKGYCDKLSSNKNLLRCSAYVKCTTAIWMSFTPSIRNLYEGSTWCTFLQLSIGCAEHALQSRCLLEGDTKLQQNIRELDRLRVETCEKRALEYKNKGGTKEENAVDRGQYKQVDRKGDNSATDNRNSFSRLFLLLLAIPVLSSRSII